MDKKLYGIEQRLLDTGKRNRLINFKKSNISTIEIVFDIYKLFDELEEGKIYNFAKLFTELDEDLSLNDEEKARITNSLSGIMPYKIRYSKEEINQLASHIKDKKVNYLFSTSHENNLMRTLNLLRNKSHLFFVENGINPLFLAFGFLNYIENNEKFSAPLILIPVSIKKNKLTDRPTLIIEDDEPVYNINLIEKLLRDYRVNINVEFTDLKEYFTEINEIVKKLNFSVDESIYLGLFSFSKIMMYQDIASNEELVKQNQIVKAFFNQPSTLNDGLKLEEVDLDKVESISQQNQVLYADSSQYKAIYHAKKGLSFVLQGPPGTGKSQTITNMLAELIASKKRILFVCEKRQALEVVYRNLKKRDLSQYALCLFDTNVNKKEVVEDIYQNLLSVQDNRVEISDYAKQVLTDVEDAHYELNDYFRILTNKIMPLNKSLYELIAWHNDSMERLNTPFNNILEIKEDELSEYLEEIERFEFTLKKLNSKPQEHPFFLFNRNSLSLDESQEFKTLIKESYTLLDDIIYEVDVIREKTSLTFKNLNGIANICNFIRCFNVLNGINTKYFSYHNIKLDYDTFKVLQQLIEENKNIRQNITQKYKLEFLDLNEDSLLNELNNKYNSRLKRLFGYKKIEEYIESFLNTKAKLNYETIINDLHMLQKYKNKYREILIAEVSFKEKYDEYVGFKTNFTQLGNIIKSLLFIENTSSLLENYNPLFLKETIGTDTNEVYLNAKISPLEKMIERLNITIDKLNAYYDYDLKEEEYHILLTKLKVSYLNFSKVYDYVDFIKAFQTINPKLNEFKHEFLNLSSTNLTSIFKNKFASCYLDEYLKEKSNLEIFSNAYLNHFLWKYQENDDKIFDIAKSKIKEIVTSSWPQLDSLMANNLEVKTLVEEANKKRKLRSLRTLFKEIPKILTDLKPIIMATPMSVATFLEPGTFNFDCVIFDEASQLTLANALGAIYRSKQVIIVGDNEQLPPTSFFDMISIDDEDEEDYDVYESLLDEAIVTLPKIMLKWHYRSKDESLINFSNQKIYHDLTSFPSSIISDNLGIKLEYVKDATYYHGKRINPCEAKRVIEVLEDIVKNRPEKSVGIVTFNMAMQQYLENLITVFRLKNPEYEAFFDEEKTEAFFIKNLETVQGDERDIIILATTFGYDEKQKLSFNFGPINKEGGYRRLNVAITRAKEELILVTSLNNQDFNSTKSTNRGVLMFRDYLAYAQEAKELAHSGTQSSDEMITSIQSFLNKNGFKTITNLGLSEFKIDLAVYSSKGDSYKLAILSDGPSYQKLKTIRDRNHLIDKILKTRGWNVYHIWSLAYLKQKELIHQEILDHLTSKNQNDVISNNDDAFYEIKVQSSATKLEDLFEVYPDINKMILECDLTKNKHDNINEIMKRIIPVSFKELKKLILPLYGKTRMSPSLSKEMDEDIKNVIEKCGYKTSIGFILDPNHFFNIPFRKHQEGYYYPPIDGIYIEELENAILTILKEIKTTNRKTLFQTLNSLIGYAKGSIVTIETYENVIKALSELGDITLTDDIISVEDIL